MESIIQEITSELADNWPAFLYIAMTTGFSICFLRERRAETQILKQMGARLEQSIRYRFDRLERLVETSNKDKSAPEIRRVQDRVTAEAASTSTGTSAETKMSRLAG